LNILEHVLFGAKHRGRVRLNGIERFWVHQSNPADCWAAALETARMYRSSTGTRSEHISQDKIRHIAGQYCPKYNNGAATAYEISYMLSSLQRDYDHVNEKHFICTTFGCIIDSISRGHPVIMLKSGHATLIVGAEFTKDGQVGEEFQVLDPAGNGKIENVSIFGICTAEVLISY
jgi:hypothetical protein